MRDYAKKNDLLVQKPGMARVNIRKHNQAASRGSISTEKEKPPVKWLRWVLLLGVLCTIGWSLYHFALKPRLLKPDFSPASQRSSGSQSKSVSQVGANSPKPSSKDLVPKFDFYHMLAEQTVNVPEKTTSTDASNKQFFVQVASYKTSAEAEAMKVKLIGLGFDPKTTYTDTGWYQVTLGPIDSMRAGDVIRHKLQTQGINGSFVRSA